MRRETARKRESARDLDARHGAQHAAASEFLGEHAAAEPDGNAVAADDGVDDVGRTGDDAVADPGADARGADDDAERESDVPDDDERVQRECGSRG